MLTPVLIGAAALLAPIQQQIDTVVAVPAGARVEVENFAGEVVVRTWDRNAVRVVARHSGRDRVAIRPAGAALRIETADRQGAARTVDYQLTIPASAALRVTGAYNDVSIEGAGGDVSVETIRGDVQVRGGNGVVTLSSVEGTVGLEGARGRVRANAVNKGIRIARTSGDITAETVNGSIVMERIESSSVEASTVNGRVEYEGTLRDGGRYALTTHNGRILLTVPDGTNATVSVATFNGSIDSALPVSIREVRRGRRFSFTLGNGSARIDLESFNGAIQLRRPGGTTNQENQR